MQNDCCTENIIKNESTVQREKPVRVLHYIGKLIMGGSQSFVMELYRNIDRQKVQFDFVTFPNPQGEIYDEILSLGGKVYECPKYNGVNHFSFVKWWDRFLSEHPEYKVVHGHVRSVASIYLPIMRKHNRYTILHSHSMSNGHGLKSGIKALLQRPVRHMADYYMACSDDAGEWLFGDKIVRGDSYKTIPNAINTERFVYSEENRMAVRTEYGLKDSFVIGHVGRFVGEKNQAFLLDVLERLIKNHGLADVVLLLVGDGVLKESIEKDAISRGIHRNIVFAGSRADTERFYSAMDVFLFPSKWEGLGIVAVEAQVNGLPCILSDVIPRKADICSDLVERLSTASPEEWCGSIIRLKDEIAVSARKRVSHTEEANLAGYDVKQNAGIMEEFYYKKANPVSDAS